jgi:hypothetical protein
LLSLAILFTFLKINIRKEETPQNSTLTFTGSIPRSPITKSPSNDAMIAFLTSSSAFQAPNVVMHPSSVPLPRPRPKRL